MDRRPRPAAQLEELGRNLSQAIRNLSQEAASQADQSGVLGRLDWSERIGLLPSPLGIASGATAVASIIIGAAVSLLIVIFFGIYLALDPDTYVRLVLRFAPAERRRELRALLAEMGEILRKWLSGQLAAMAGGGAGHLCWPAGFGRFAGLRPGAPAGLVRIHPLYRAHLGAAPMLLVAAGQGLDMLVWVYALYVDVQLLES